MLSLTVVNGLVSPAALNCGVLGFLNLLLRFSPPPLEFREREESRAHQMHNSTRLHEFLLSIHRHTDQTEGACCHGKYEVWRS